MSSFVGRIVLTLNGAPIAEAKSVRPRTMTGAKSLKGMSPTGKPIGMVEGTPEYTLDLELYVRTIATIDLYTLTNAVLTITPRDGVGRTTVYTGVFTIDVSEAYQEDGEATRSVSVGALDRLEV